MTDQSVLQDAHLELFTSSFCAACARTRQVLNTVTEVVPQLHLIEYDVAFEPSLAESRDITATPTTIIRNAAGAEVFRATGIPTPDQVLSAALAALLPDNAIAASATSAAEDQRRTMPSTVEDATAASLAQAHRGHGQTSTQKQATDNESAAQP